MLDTLKTIETPEGIELSLSVAGPLPRILAWLIDGLARFFILYLLMFLLSTLDLFGFGLFMLAAFIAEWFYPVLFEVCMGGQTPGKKALGLRVLCDDGTPVGWSASLLRNLLRVVDFLPMLYGFGLASMVLNRDFKRLGDLAAGTLVVYSGKIRPQPRIGGHSPIPPPAPLTLEEQQAIIAFAERMPAVSEDRARELAALAGPLAPAGEEISPDHLLGIANWLLGRR
ncbi:MAG TPA: RDD family protein [Sedimenticola sp.]|nr:RDD family protein [Sedimenticola sp.]